MVFDNNAARYKGNVEKKLAWESYCSNYEIPLVMIEVRRKYGTVEWSLETLPEEKKLRAHAQSQIILDQFITIHAKYKNSHSSSIVSANGGAFYDINSESCNLLAEEIFKFLIEILSTTPHRVH